MKRSIVELMRVPSEQHDLLWLQDSLQAAIELELSTLPPYLCALWSIKDTASTLVGAEDAYKLVQSVVLEEMLHLGLSCNMLTALGCVPILNSNLPTYPGHLPGGVRPELTVYLAGLSKDYLKKVCMQIEYPDGGPVALTAMGETYPTIGAFYDAISEAFQTLQPSLNPTNQLDGATLNGYPIYPVITLADVQKAISEIKEQGEGTSETPEVVDFGGELAALSHLALALPELDNIDYIKHVILPALETNFIAGERLYLPMIDPGNGTKEAPGFSKEHALPYLYWGLLYNDWAPPEFGSKEDTGITVFIQGYENRSKVQADDPNIPDNLRKRIYYSALTSDLMGKYSPKAVKYFDWLFSEQNANKPLMSEYLDSYADLYWNLHLSVTGTEIPAEVRDIQKSFNTVLAYGSPVNPEDPEATKIFHDNYMNVRNLRQSLFNWLDGQIETAKMEKDDTTFVYYWLENSEQGEDINFRTKDIRFECFHNFVALSQWGNTIYNIMSLLSPDSTDPQAKAIKEWFERTMQSPLDSPKDEPFSPLDRFIMELFRYISPNPGSLSVIKQMVAPLFPKYGYVRSPHKATSELPAHWDDPTIFNPERYLKAPTSPQNDAARSKEIGFAQCPFSKESFTVKDGRDAELTNSIFGTVYGVVEGEDNPVCDYAGYAPFGFGYRRCPGELLNIEVFKVFLEKVWNDKIEFYNLHPADPQLVPVGPGTVVFDIYGFRR